MILEFLTSLCCVLFAPDTLDLVTVSASRDTATMSSSPVRQMSNVKMERLGITELEKALNQFSGVSIKDYGGVGGLKTVSIRNMGAAHTSIIYDGIAITDAQNGQVDISRFRLDDIASISLTIGAEEGIFRSPRHLSSAGVLRIETALPSFRQGNSEISSGVTAGSFGLAKPYFSLKQKVHENGALCLSVDMTRSKGNYPFLISNGSVVSWKYRENSEVLSFNGEVAYLADWKGRGRVRAKLCIHSSERGLPGAVVLYTDNSPERLCEKSLISNIMYENQWSDDLKLHVDIGVNSSYNRHIDYDPVYQEPLDSKYLQNEYTGSARMLYRLHPGWSLSLAEDLFVNTLNSNIPECPFPVRLSSVSAFAAEYKQEKLKADLTLAMTYVSENVQKGKVPDDIFRLSPMASLSWNFSRNWYFRASYKDGFRVPTFNDLYYARVGNTSLKPEKSRQGNIGLTYSGIYDRGTLSISLDGYCNYMKDKITAIPTMFIWKVRNVGKVLMTGADIAMNSNIKVSDWLRFHLSCGYSYQYAKDVTDPLSKSYMNQIPYVPLHCGNGSMSLEFSWFTLSYTLTGSGKRYADSQNMTSNEIGKYLDHGISINRSFDFGNKHDYKIYVGVECLNLGNTNYQIIRSYPMPGRSFRMTLKLRKN